MTSGEPQLVEDEVHKNVYLKHFYDWTNTDLFPRQIEYSLKVGRKTVATAQVSENPEDRYWHIDKVFALEPGKGYGRKLFTLLDSKAREQGIYLIDLDAVKQIGFRSPLNFYKKMGFKIRKRGDGATLMTKMMQKNETEAVSRLEE